MCISDDTNMQVANQGIASQILWFGFLGLVLLLHDYSCPFISPL